MFINVIYKSLTALGAVSRYVKNYLLVDLSDYPEIGVSFKINLFILALFIAFIMAMLVTNHLRGSMYLLIKQMIRHGATDESGAKTLLELGLKDNRTVKSQLCSDGQLSYVVARVGKAEYTYEEYVALQKKGELKKEKIDFTTARFYIKESGQDRARRIFNSYNTSWVKGALYALLLLAVYVGVSIIVPEILDIINGYLANL